ncbi:hypothetical protein D3Z48_10415 [Clostridiaceae bacterium]|nr:hypothetical protein [Clostridiaceae bacterium]
MKNAILHFVVNENILGTDDIPLFRHALDTIQHHLWITVSILAIGIVSGHPLEAIAFTCMYPLMRKYSGGVHSISRKSCYLLTIFSFLVLLFLNSTVAPLLLSYLAIIAGGFVIQKSPLEDSQNILNLRQKKQYSHNSVFTITAALVVSLAGLAIKHSQVCTTILLSVIFTAIDILIISIRQKDGREIYHKMLCNAVLLVAMIGTYNLQGTCDGWKYQPEITASLRKYMDN